MKLAAIYNVFDGVELLDASIKTIYDHVDVVLIIYQNVSNFGEKHDVIGEIEWMSALRKVTFVKFDPIVDMGGAMNERAKRNLGIDFARDNHCTHFFAIDVDEFHEDFAAAKKLYIDSGHAGSVMRMRTYFKKPTFMFDRPEDYFVPFIHRMNEDTKSGSSSYKFYVDPTRGITETDVVELPVFMDHYSWCRKDIARKARNSSAPGIASNRIIMQDYNSPELGDGYFLTNWNRKITVVPDKFNLTHIFES
jgi:hypothetical protein